MKSKIPIQITEPSDGMKHQLILSGLADVQAGRTVPAEEVKQWAKALLNFLQTAEDLAPKVWRRLP